MNALGHYFLENKREGKQERKNERKKEKEGRTGRCSLLKGGGGGEGILDHGAVFARDRCR